MLGLRSVSRRARFSRRSSAVDGGGSPQAGGEYAALKLWVVRQQARGENKNTRNSAAFRPFTPRLDGANREPSGRAGRLKKFRKTGKSARPSTAGERAIHRLAAPSRLRRSGKGKKCSDFNALGPFGRSSAPPGCPVGRVGAGPAGKRRTAWAFAYGGSVEGAQAAN